MKKYKPLEVDDASPCMKCGSVQCAFCSEDVKSALNGLKYTLDCIKSKPEDVKDRPAYVQREANYKNILLKEFLRYIDDWFPSLKEK